MINSKKISQESIDRFFKKIRPMTTAPYCCEWIGAKQYGGYGIVTINKKTLIAHRVSWELFCGEIPCGMQIDHLCRNRCCVNTHHLRVTTPRENVLAGESMSAKNARKTHCKRGHELSKSNIRIYHGARMCRQCAKNTTINIWNDADKRRKMLLLQKVYRRLVGRSDRTTAPTGIDSMNRTELIMAYKIICESKQSNDTRMSVMKKAIESCLSGAPKEMPQ